MMSMRKRANSNEGDEFVECLGCYVKAESAKALLVVQFDAGDGVWVPKSQIDPESEVQEKFDTGTLRVRRWIADDKGLEIDAG